MHQHKLDEYFIISLRWYEIFPNKLRTKFALSVLLYGRHMATPLAPH